MMKFLRSQSQIVLVLILIALGGGFVFYGIGNVGSPGGGRGSNDYGRIGGEDLSVADLYSAIRTTRGALILAGHEQQLNDPGARAQVAEEAWAQLLLLHEADRLHIEVSEREVVDYIRDMQLFQKDGVYSPELYQLRMAQLETAYQITPDMFADIIRDSLRTNAVRQALLSSVRASTADMEQQYDKYYGPVQLSVITFDPKNYLGAATATADEIASAYKAHPDNPDYRTEEKRKVDYVLLPLTPEQMKLPAKEKTAAIEALGEKALNFALALQPQPTSSTNNTPAAWPDFQAEAAKMGLHPVTTDFFSADTPPTGLPPSPAFNNAAFALSKDDPISKVVALDNGVAVLHLDDIQPSELRPLDEVKAGIAQQVQQGKADAAAQVAAEKASEALQAALAKGTDFKTAAAALKLNIETVPTFVPATAPRNDPRMANLAYTAVGLKPGEISQPIPMESNNTIGLVYLDSRGVADKAGLAKFETQLRENQDQQLRNVVAEDWANWMDKQPGTHKPPDLDGYGGVE